MEEQQKRDRGAVRELYEKTLPKLASSIHEKLSEITHLFHDFHLKIVVDTWTRSPEDSSDLPVSMDNGNVLQMGLRLKLEGFQRAGVTPFDISKDLVFKLGDDSYQVMPEKGTRGLEKHYYQPWSKQEIEVVTSLWCNALIDDITQRLKHLMD